MDTKLSPIPIDTLHPVSPADAAEIWIDIRRYIEEANAFGGGKLTAEDWLAKILIGQADLFIYPGAQSAAICEAQQFQRRRVYGVILCGGEGGHDWRRYQAAFEAAARMRGCDCTEVFGRPGWKHVMKDLGYDMAHWVWRKTI